MTEESITTIEIAPSSKLYRPLGHWCPAASIRLVRMVGVLLSIIGFCSLIVLWAYINQQRTQLRGHYEYWLYQQVCPTTMANAAKQPSIDDANGLPIPTTYYGSQRFYEACVAEARK
jgi:hypothetical protein